jgi:phage repressor protein C with HTH and peptisase S24 domain
MGYDFPILKNLSELKKSDLYQSSTYDKLSFTYQKKHGCFVLKVDGDSMSPTVENGDYVLVDEELKLYDGAIVAAKLKSGEQFIKRYRVLPEEFIQLDSDNFVYDPITLKKNETEYLIPVVMLQRNIYKNQTM